MICRTMTEVEWIACASMKHSEQVHWKFPMTDEPLGPPGQCEMLTGILKTLARPNKRRWLLLIIRDAFQTELAASNWLTQALQQEPHLS